MRVQIPPLLPTLDQNSDPKTMIDTNMRTIFFFVATLMAFLTSSLAQLPAPSLPPFSGYRIDACGPAAVGSFALNLGRPCVGGVCTEFDDCFAYVAIADVSFTSTCEGARVGSTVHIVTLPLTGINSFLFPQPVGTVVLPVFMVGPHNALQANLGPTIAEPGHDMLYVDLNTAVLIPAAWSSTYSVLTSFNPPTTAPLETFGVSWPLPMDPATVGLAWDIQMARLVPSGLLYMSSSTTWAITP